MRRVSGQPLAINARPEKQTGREGTAPKDEELAPPAVLERVHCPASNSEDCLPDPECPAAVSWLASHCTDPSPGFAACFIPAWRAAHLDPAQDLRYNPHPRPAILPVPVSVAFGHGSLVMAQGTNEGLRFRSPGSGWSSAFRSSEHARASTRRRHPSRKRRVLYPGSSAPIHPSSTSRGSPSKRSPEPSFPVLKSPHS